MYLFSKRYLLDSLNYLWSFYLINRNNFISLEAITGSQDTINGACTQRCAPYQLPIGDPGSRPGSEDSESFRIIGGDLCSNIANYLFKDCYVR